MNGTIRYTIRPYDTIWMLAQVFNTTVDAIMELNPGIEPTNLMVGQVVTIRPGYQYYPAYPGNSGNQDMNMGRDMNMGHDMNMGRDMDMGHDMDMEGEMEDLVNLFRMLWEQHIAWTRMAVMGIVHGLPDAEMMIQRLLQNPLDFADALANFYGEEAAQEFAQLFTEHLTIAAELVQAVKAGNNEAVMDADRRWRENAEQIAMFLADINPNWSEDDWSAMLMEHLDLLSDNISNMIAGNYQESIDGYDDIELQALEMADMMADGIMMQFPGGMRQ